MVLHKYIKKCFNWIFLSLQTVQLNKQTKRILQGLLVIQSIRIALHMLAVMKGGLLKMLLLLSFRFRIVLKLAFRKIKANEGREPIWT